MDALQKARHYSEVSEARLDKENHDRHDYNLGLACAQLATANAIIALVERLDKMTDSDNQALRTVALK